MADVKISALPLATTPLAGTEVLPIVQSATTDQVSVANLTAGRAVSAASLTLTTTPLAVGSGGTGLTSLTAGYVPYASNTSTLSFSSPLYTDGTSVGIGTTSLGYKLDVNGSIRAQTSLLVNTTYSTAWTPNTSASQIYIANNYALNNSTALFQCTALYGDSTTTGVQFGAVATNSYSADFIVANRNNGTYKENLRVTAAGNVGIGSSNPTNIANYTIITTDLAGGTGSGIYMAGNGTVYGRFLANSTACFMGARTGQYLSLEADGSEKARIDTSGNLLVGTTSSANTTYSIATFAGAAKGIAIKDTTSSVYRAIYISSGSGGLYFWNGTNEGYLNSAGAWTNASDGRLKKNIVDIKYGLEAVLSTMPRSFERKDVDGEYVGFIAQELQQIIPEVVSGDPNKQLGVDYGSLVAVAFKAIQELAAKVAELEAKI